MSCKSWWWRGNDNPTGTSGPDWLFGSWRDDIIDGGAGNDFIWAGGGDNVVDGGTGNDFIWARNGDDLIDGGAGNDFIRSGGGDDIVNGGAGNDWIRSGRGNDIVSGGGGNDWIRTGSGDDIADGGTGNDSIRGGRGDDILNGGDGNDYVKGGSGDDILIDGGGSDKVYGGSGNDKFIYSVTENAASKDHVGSKDYFNGGRGQDVLILQMTHAEHTAEMQAELEAYIKFLAQPGYCWKYQSYEFESFGLKVKNFEKFEIQYTDDPASQSKNVAPEPVDDALVLLNVNEVESNDPVSGTSLVDTAQAIARSSFLTSPSRDVGNETLPRVSIVGAISHNDDVDVYALELKAGETVTLDIDYGYTSTTVPPDTLMTQLWVLDANQNVLNDPSKGFFSDPNAGGMGSETFFDALVTYTNNTGTDGTFYVAVSSVGRTPGVFNSGGGSSGDYVLNVSLETTDPTLGSAMVIQPDDLLLNDLDADGDPLTIVRVENAVNGTVELIGSGEIVFTPGDVNLPGGFDYVVSDGVAETPATVAINGNLIVAGSSPGDPSSTPEDDLLVGRAGVADDFHFSDPSGNDTIAGFELGVDKLVLDSGQSFNVQESSNGTLISFNTGDSVLLDDVTGIEGNPDNVGLLLG